MASARAAFCARVRGLGFALAAVLTFDTLALGFGVAVAVAAGADSIPLSPLSGRIICADTAATPSSAAVPRTPVIRRVQRAAALRRGIRLRFRSAFTLRALESIAAP